MRNPLTYEMESYLGSAFISCLAMFFISLLFIAMKNFDSDLSVMSSQEVEIRTFNTTERTLIDNWLSENQIKIPRGKSYYYILQQYPSKPWLR